MENEYQSKPPSDFENITPQYLLYMIYKGIYEIPNSNADYINWLGKRLKEFNAQREFGIKNFIKYLMYFVRDSIVNDGGGIGTGRRRE